MPLKLRVFFDSNMADEVTQNYSNKIQKFNENQIKLLKESYESDLEVYEKLKEKNRRLERERDYLLAAKRSEAVNR
jgi:hypothetical protein